MSAGGWRDGELFDPSGWLDVGFTIDEARIWHRWRIDPRTAVAWRAAGVPDGLQAAQWTVAGVRPETVRQWRAAGIEPHEAVHWHEIGVDLAAAAEHKRHGRSPHDALKQSRLHSGASRPDPIAEAFQRFHEAGVRPELAHGYAMAGWVDKEALDWARQGLGVADARLWKLLGVTPAEANRLEQQGQAPDRLLRDWWRAGIPYDEVGVWLGAGLTAEEAAAQRAQGITAEQAAALRALREGDDLDD
jgi:hypothetical protein